MSRLRLLAAACVTGVVLALVPASSAQSAIEVGEWPTPAAEDVATMDGIMRAYYEVVSGPAGSTPDWDRDKSLHLPGARVAITGTRNDSLTVSWVTISGWHEASPPTRRTGFFEYEIDRKVRQHGSTVHVWSTYEWRAEEAGPPMGQGINSIEMIWDGERYWITSWSFDGRGTPVPLEYLPGNG